MATSDEPKASTAKASASKKKATSTKTATTKTATAKSKRPQAVADDLDFNNTAEEAELKSPPRRSKWVVLLDKLYDATVTDKVPRSDDGSLKFIRLGAFTNVNGARTQARALVQRGLDETYEFKTVTKGDDGSELWGRVIEVEA